MWKPGRAALGAVFTCLAAPSAIAYHTYDQLHTELLALQTAHPTRAQLISIGHGWELVGRDQRQIWALKITEDVGKDSNKPEIVFVGGHHAREWVSVEIPLGIAQHLLNNVAKDPSIAELVTNKVVWVIPMLNPDGHAYTATNRCWRKNRRNNGDGSIGVDLNRNYGYQWGLLSGSSNVTTSHTYHGPAAFSEPETQAFRDFLRARRNLRAVVSYHSFTQAFLRPWSYHIDYEPGSPPPPAEEMSKALSDELRARIGAVHGEVYKDCLSQADRLPSGACPSPPHYEASGEMADWIHHEFNIPAFTIEVRPRTASQWPAPLGCPGFELPDAEVGPTIAENIPAALALIHYAQPGKIMIRDHVGDTGQVPSSTWTASGWDPVFWLSPDIRTEPDVPVRGSTATIWARVHNLTSAPLSNVTVKIYSSDPSINLEFPNPNATLLGEGVISLPASGSAEFSASWAVPSTPNAVGEHHWCVGVVIKHADDLPLSTQALYSNNVAHHNFTPIETLSTAQALRFVAENSSTMPKDLEILVSAGGLPRGWDVQLDPKRPKILAPGERYAGFAHISIPAGARAGEGLVAIHGAVKARRPGVVAPTGSGVTYRVKYTPADDGVVRKSSDRWSDTWSNTWYWTFAWLLPLAILAILLLLVVLLFAILRRLRHT